MANFIKSIFTIDFLMCFLLVVASGNPIFIYSPNVRELYIILALLSIIYNIYKKGQGIATYARYAMVFFIVMMIQQVIIPGLSISSQIFSLIRILIGVLIITGIKEKFALEYVKVMTVVAAISLVLFPLTLRFGLLPSVQISKIGYSMYVYTQIFTDYGGTLARNAGMFWEPGAFQGYLNLAIAIALLLPKNVARRNSLIILIAALLTTYSTTGYIVFAFIIVYYLYRLSNYRSVNRTIITFFVLLGIIYAFYSLEFMHDKLVDNLAETDSTQGRVTGFIRMGDIIIENFLLGINTEDFDTSSGNGLIYMLLYYGGCLTVFYFVKLYKNIYRLYGSKIAFYIFMFVLISLQGEGFMFYPVYLALPFLVLDFSRPLLYSVAKNVNTSAMVR